MATLERHDEEDEWGGKTKNPALLDTRRLGSRTGERTVSARSGPQTTRLPVGDVVLSATNQTRVRVSARAEQLRALSAHSQRNTATSGRCMGTGTLTVRQQAEGQTPGGSGDRAEQGQPRGGADRAEGGLHTRVSPELHDRRGLGLRCTMPGSSMRFCCRNTGRTSHSRHTCNPLRYT